MLLTAELGQHQTSNICQQDLERLLKSGVSEHFALQEGRVAWEHELRATTSFSCCSHLGFASRPASSTVP
jgi:hypothetical protein